jgi:hypothetical protein
MGQLDELIFYKTGAMSFHNKNILREVVTEILTAATSCTWLGRWRMISVTDSNRRVRVVEVWQDGLRKIGRLKDADFIERWKLAPLFIAFCHPKNFEPFGWVPAEYARVYSIQEIGTAVRSLELKALEHGISLHGIMGMLLPEICSGVNAELAIPETQELVFFGVMGYPNETVEQKFPKIEDVCYFEGWKQR